MEKGMKYSLKELSDIIFFDVFLGQVVETPRWKTK
jgi:hypothetical protein